MFKATITMHGERPKTLRFEHFDMFRDRIEIHVARLGELVFFIHFDPKTGEKIFVAENTLQLATAPAVASYLIKIDGQEFSCSDHRRLRRTYWIVSGEPAYQETDLIRGNGINWKNYWRHCPPMSVQPVIPPKQDTRGTGGAQRHGFRLAWANDPEVCIVAGRVYGHLPITLRDPLTLRIVRNSSILLGYNPNKQVLGVDVKTLGMKLDTGHLWSALEAYLASVGTVLELYYYELLEALAVYCCMSDHGNLIQKEVRGAGRSLRAVADWLLASDVPDPFCRDHLVKAFNYYESNSVDVWGIHRGDRRDKKTNAIVIGLFEYAQLAYGLSLAEKVLKRKSTYLSALLQRQYEYGSTPYEIEIGSADGRIYGLDEIHAIEKQKAAAAAAIKRNRYVRFLGEDFGFNLLRAERGQPLTNPPSGYDPKILSNGRNAGFYLLPPAGIEEPKPTPAPTDPKVAKLEQAIVLLNEVRGSLS